MFEIHIVSRVNIVGIRANLVRLMSHLAKSSFATGSYAPFQTFLFEYFNFNINSYYLMLVGTTVSWTKWNLSTGFLT